MVSGKLLNKLRLQRGLSIDDIANELNVSTSTVYRWEREDSLKDRKTIERYAEVLGVRTAYLLTGEHTESANAVAESVDEIEKLTKQMDKQKATKKQLSLFKIGLISAGSSLLFFVILTALIVVCIYFKPKTGNGSVIVFLFSEIEVIILVCIILLCIIAITSTIVLICYLVRKKRNKKQ